MHRNLCQIVMVALVALPIACPVVGAQESDPVAEYLDSHEMVDLLEVHLSTKINLARNDEGRADAVKELAAFYLDQIRSLDRESSLRALLLPRAWDFTLEYEGESLVELRLELLIDRYLPIENTVDLHQLLLDDPDERVRAKAELVEIERHLQRLETQLQSKTRKLEVLLRKGHAARDAESNGGKLEDARRNLSLTRYYIGWAGYSRAVLENRQVPRETMESFGWLLGAKGRVPTLEDLDRAFLQYEHVARAAIGSALCQAQNGDLMTARIWIKQIVNDEKMFPEVVPHAKVRRLQIEAMDAQWSEVHDIIVAFHNETSEPLRLSEARFVAIAVLNDQQRSQEFNPNAEVVAQLVLEDLVKLGEIGHILDLHRRFGSLPLIANRFISQYASALMELEHAEQDGDQELFIAASALFKNALKAQDADLYPDERDDCSLKLAYCAIKGGRQKEAIQTCDRLIARNPSAEVLEQARWLRIVAMETVVANRGEKSAKDLVGAVTEYILAYPDSSNAARLLLRHGTGGAIDTTVAIHTLLQLPEDDPATIPARRMLVQLFHQQYRASGGDDQLLVDDVIDLVQWLWSKTPDEPVSIADARTRMAIIRITLDIVSADEEENKGVIARAILRGLLLVDFDPALTVYKDEILLRRVEFLLVSEKLDRAEQQLALMTDSSSSFALAAARLILVASLEAWETDPSNKSAIDRVIAVGSTLIESELPPPPEKLDAGNMAVIAAVAKAAEHRAVRGGDSSSLDLAYRMCLLILDRGLPDEETLRRITRLAEQRDDPETALEAWLILLTRHLSTDPLWYEARYESFRLLLIIDPDRAALAMDQYRVLHPNPGPEPWGSKIRSLLAGSLSEDEG